jgi:hypothetical protein
MNNASKTLNSIGNLVARNMSKTNKRSKKFRLKKILNSEKKYQMFSTKRKIEYDSDEIYYIHEFKRAHIEPLFGFGRSAKHSITKVPPFLKTCDEEAVLKPTESLKLFDMCLRFIASNLECVDSLTGLPDQIGQLLYKGKWRI